MKVFPLKGLCVTLNLLKLTGLSISIQGADISVILDSIEKGMFKKYDMKTVRKKIEKLVIKDES